MEFINIFTGKYIKSLNHLKNFKIVFNRKFNILISMILFIKYLTNTYLYENKILK